MKRKLIGLGNGCLVVSLPMKYVRKHNLAKGMDIQLVEEGNDLKVSLAKVVAENLSFSFGIGLNQRIGRRVIAASYRLGMDEVRLSYDNPEYFESIQNTLQTETIGFEVVKQEELSCTIKDLSRLALDNFDNIVQRCWFLLIDIAKDTLDGMKKKDYALLRTIHAKDRAVNKFTNYAMRMLLRSGSFSQAKTISFYHFLHSFEELSDEYQDMASYVGEQKISVPNNYLLVLEGLNACVREFLGVFNKFDETNAEKAINKVVAIQEKLHKGMADIAAYYLIGICRRIRNLMVSLVEIRLCELVWPAVRVQ